MEKIVVLNSGGYDSISLLNYLHLQEEYEIHTIHFLYGANNEKQQLDCAKRGAERIGATIKVVTLPPIDWTKNRFYSGDFDLDTQYLEYRNLIFLAYAASYAEAIGATKIAIAVLKNGSYSDTNPDFLKAFSSCLSGIEVITPFIDCEKEDLTNLLANLTMGILPSDYFSCDRPVDGKPCGECADCRSLTVINYFLKKYHEPT